MANFEIHRAKRQDVDDLIEAAAGEGWNPGPHDAGCFWAIDPDGFFIGKLDGKPIGRASALCYDETFAFCGFYIVDSGYRGKGYGLQITHARLDYIGDRNVGLDGVLDMVDKYARLGYRTAHLSTRHTHTPTAKHEAPAQVVAAAEVAFDTLLDYDTRHFFTRREAFLRCWVNQPGSAVQAFVDDGVLRGYGVIRSCREGHKIGPLFADDAEIADVLYRALCNHGLNTPVLLDVPEANAAGMKLVKRYQMAPVFSCARMYMRGDPGLPLDHIYGITTFEAG